MSVQGGRTKRHSMSNSQRSLSVSGAGGVGDDQSVLSELSGASFSSTKLGKLLANAGLHPDEDVPVNTSNQIMNQASSLNHDEQQQRRPRRSSLSSARSRESSKQGFADSKLGKLLAKRGLQPNQKVHVMGMGETLGDHFDARESSSTSSPTAVVEEAKSVHSESSVSFSDTALGKMLAKKGVQATNDFEVFVKSSIVDPNKRRRRRSKRSPNNVATSRSARTSRKLAQKGRGSRSHSFNGTMETISFQEDSFGSSLGIMDPMYEDPNEEEKYNTFSGSESSPNDDGPGLNNLARALFATKRTQLYRDECGLNEDSFQDENLDLPPVVSPAEKRVWRSALDHEHNQEDDDDDDAEEFFCDEEAQLPFDGDALCLSAWDSEQEQGKLENKLEDKYLCEFGYDGSPVTRSPNTSVSPSRDADVSCRSTRSIDVSCRSTRSIAWQPEEDRDPYSENLQPCDIQQLSSNKEEPRCRLSRRKFVWGSVLGTVLLVLSLILFHHSGKKSESPIAVPSSPAPTFGPTAAPTVHEPETIMPPPRPHTMDDQFAHDWSLATFETPIENYAVHPLLRDGSTFNVTVTVPAGLGYTLTSPPDVALVLAAAHLPWSLGSRGCEDMRPYAVVSAGSKVDVTLPSGESSQVMACMNDRIVAIGNHMMVKDWLVDNGETYSLQILDMRESSIHSNRMIYLQPGSVSGVDRVYLLLIGMHHNFIWLPTPSEVEIFNQTLSDHPDRKESCANEEGLHWHGIGPASAKDMDHFVLWDFSSASGDLKTIVTQCIEGEFLARPVGHVFVRAHSEDNEDGEGDENETATPAESPTASGLEPSCGGKGSVSPNNRCGLAYGYCATSTDPYCSRYGFCGSSPAHQTNSQCDYNHPGMCGGSCSPVTANITSREPMDPVPPAP